MENIVSFVSGDTANTPMFEESRREKCILDHRSVIKLAQIAEANCRMAIMSIIKNGCFAITVVYKAMTDIAKVQSL